MPFCQRKEVRRAHLIVVAEPEQRFSVSFRDVIGQSPLEDGARRLQVPELEQDKTENAASHPLFGRVPFGFPKEGLGWDLEALGIMKGTKKMEAAQKLADAIRAADGVIFNTPEYNFSIPGGLKNAIDWVSRVPNQPFAGKPVAVQSATGGPLGGGRMQYDLRRTMLFLDALTFGRPEIFIGNCSQRIDAKTGEITDQQTIGFIRQQLNAFATFIERHGGKR